MLSKIGHKFTYFVRKLAYFQKTFDQIREIWTFPYLWNFSIFCPKVKSIIQIGPQIHYFAEKIGLFSQDFWPNKGNLDIPLFVKFLNFDANKGKFPLFVFPYLDSPLYKTISKSSL